MNALADALAVETDTSPIPIYNPEMRPLDLYELIEECSDLIIITRIDDTDYAQLAHSSVLQYLDSEDARLAWPNLSPVTANACLTISCLAYLLHSSASVDSEALARDEFALHAARFWNSYYARLSSDRNKTIIDLMLFKLFCQDDAAYTNWTRLFTIDRPWIKSSGTSSPLPALYTAAYAGLEPICNHLLRAGQDPNVHGGLHARPLVAAALNGHLNIVEMLIAAGARNETDDRYTGHFDNALRVAVASGECDVVKVLLEHGRDPQGWKLDRRGSNLMIAVSHGYIDICRLLLAEGVRDKFHPKSSQPTALEAAITRGHQETAFLLLQTWISGDGKPSFTTRERSRVYRAAASNEQMEILRQLLSYEADKNLTLKYWAQAGDTETVESLLGEQSDIDSGEGFPNFESLLSSAIQCDRSRTTETLLRWGASPNGKSQISLEIGQNATTVLLDRMPLRQAVVKNHLATVRVLIEGGADIHAMDDIVLSDAACKGHWIMFQELIKNEADPHSAEERLIQCAITGGSSQILRYLLDKGLKLPNEDSECFVTAVKKGFEHCLEIMLEHGLDVNHVFQAGTLLMAAVQSRREDIVKLLLRRGADPNRQLLEPGSAHRAGKLTLVATHLMRLLTPTPPGMSSTEQQDSVKLHEASQSIYELSPLAKACDLIDLSVVKRLVAASARVDAQDNYGISALHIAARTGNKEITTFLIETGGASLDICLQNGSRPIHSAASRNQVDCLSVFLHHDEDINVLNNDGWSALHWAAETGCWDAVAFLLDKNADKSLMAKEPHVSAYDLANLRILEEKDAYWKRKGAWSEDEVNALVARLAP